MPTLSLDQLNRRAYTRGGTATISTASATVALTVGKFYILKSSGCSWFMAHGSSSAAASSASDFWFAAGETVEVFAEDTSKNTVAHCTDTGSGTLYYMIVGQ